MCLWNVVVVFWVAFNTDQKIFDFKINFLFDFASNVSRFLIISSIRHDFYADSPLIQNKRY